MIEASDLLRFVEGECSPAEAAAIQAWIAADSARGELLDELRAVWRLTGDLTRPWDVGAAGGAYAPAALTGDRSAPATSLGDGDGVARADRGGGPARDRRRRLLVASFAACSAARVCDGARAAGGAHVSRRLPRVAQRRHATPGTARLRRGGARRGTRRRSVLRRAARSGAPFSRSY